MWEQYGAITSNGELGDFAAEVGMDGFVKLYFTPHYEVSTVITLIRTAVTM